MLHFRTFHIDILLYLLGLDEGPGPLKEPVRLLCDARLLSEPLWYDCKLLMEPLRKSNKDRHAMGMLKFLHGVIYIKSEVNRKWFMQTTNFTKGQLFLRKYILNKENNTLYIHSCFEHIFAKHNKTQQYPHLQRNCQAKHKLIFFYEATIIDLSKMISIPQWMSDQNLHTWKLPTAAILCDTWL